MPRLLRLNGRDLLRIFQKFGFEIVRVKGSHHILRRVVNGETETINIPIHGHENLAPGMIHRLYRDASRYIPESELEKYFYAE